jgi:hypothetical protein
MFFVVKHNTDKIKKDKKIINSFIYSLYFLCCKSEILKYIIDQLTIWKVQNQKLRFFLFCLLCLPGCAFNKAKGFENGYYWFMLTMSKNSNCFKVHLDVKPGPCVYCSKHDNAFLLTAWLIIFKQTIFSRHRIQSLNLISHFLQIQYNSEKC